MVAQGNIHLKHDNTDISTIIMGATPQLPLCIEELVLVSPLRALLELVRCKQVEALVLIWILLLPRLLLQLLVLLRPLLLLLIIPWLTPRTRVDTEQQCTT